MLSRAPEKGALTASFLIRRFLLPAVLLHPRHLTPHRGHRVPACPQVRARAVPRLLVPSPGESQGTRAFQTPTPRRYGGLGRDLATPLDLSGEQVPRADSALRCLASSVQKEAEACFLKVIEIARRQSAKSLELRAVMSLSRLWQQQGKKDEARQMLAEIYGWFTEGFDTADLQEAKALLDEIS